MTLSDLLTGPWALAPAKLRELQDIYAAHLQGQVPDIAAIEARMGRPLKNEAAAYEVIDTVAVLPVQGVLAPKANLMMQISGGMSLQMMMTEFKRSLADTSVRSIILHMDTPGGSVLSTPEFAALVHNASKPVVAFSDGQMASAGVWIGSAAQGVYISGPTVQVGSIGVVAQHRDFSQREAQEGVRTTEITAGRYKRIASNFEPLSQEGRVHIQEQVDYLYSLFVDAVALHMGKSTEQVLTDMADGRVFTGQQAISAGLVDGTSSLQELIAQMSKDPRAVVKRQRGPVKQAITASTTTGASAPVFIPEQERASTMSTPEAQAAAAAQATAISAAIAGLTSATLASGNPALFATLQSEFTAAGAKAERERIQAVRAQSMAGHETLIDTLAFDGTTTGPEAAVAVLQAHREKLAKTATAHFNDAPAAAAGSASGAAAAAPGAAKTRDQKAAEATAYAKEHNVDFAAAYKALGFDAAA